jgi:hypothetical protein
MDQARLSRLPRTLADLGMAPFVPRAPWWNGDLQTLRNFLVRSRTNLETYPEERLILPLGDGTGDALAATLNRPHTTVAGRPLVVLIHGLSGEENSFYMRRGTAHLLASGYRVLRLNLRGAGRSRPLCRFHYHAGRSEDLGMVLAALPPALAAEGVVAVGFSLGANMLLKYLGERGAAVPLCAAVAVSAPLDLAETARRLRRWRNTAYQLYLIRYMRAEAQAPIAELTERERRAIRAARSIWEFDDGFSAPRNGFAGAEDYYERCAARHFLGGIGIPTLIIHALDDPWIPAEAYRMVDWAGNSNLIPLLTERGGHVGFEGRDRRTGWHDLAIARFLAALSPS